MKLHYYKGTHGNFGDDLNPWLWDQLLPGFFDDDTDDIFVGIGTLLSPRIPPARRTIVFGSGAGYGSIPSTDKSWDIVCVRGPKTAELMGLPGSTAVADPAILVRLFEEHTSMEGQQISYMPHHLSSTLGDWEQVCKIAGYKYIDARNSVAEILQGLKDTRLLITEAMHGAIVADALRIPWIAVHSHEHILPLKWVDWMSSLKLEESFQTIDPVWFGEKNKVLSQRIKAKIKRSLAQFGIKPRVWTPPPPLPSSPGQLEAVATALTQIATKATPQLSEETLLCQKQEQLLELLQQTQRRYGS